MSFTKTKVHDTVSEYCKLGCAYSVCCVLTTLENSDESETLNGAAENCTKACSTFCTKDSKTTIES
ncbi:hypothetical protein ARALYDRAFT_894072 [Arabidopsis lyrata subsp. lyrata]|uniref:Uncharacterized protein n=1 Tax=Arabidopsis lyrata subsp. lyrata TaxID=81972 RepID=D7KRT5_ARALL|nr:hypothetical protein ARALYDRAFT_894072 [Arabidopsis lyrata subsp. lyrata]